MIRDVVSLRFFHIVRRYTLFYAFFCLLMPFLSSLMPAYAAAAATLRYADAYMAT